MVVIYSSVEGATTVGRVTMEAMTDQEKGNRTTAYVITFAVDETTDSDGIAFALRDYHAEFGFKAEELRRGMWLLTAEGSVPQWYPQRFVDGLKKTGAMQVLVVEFRSAGPLQWTKAEG